MTYKFYCNNVEIETKVLSDKTFVEENEYVCFNKVVYLVTSIDKSRIPDTNIVNMRKTDIDPRKLNTSKYSPSNI